MKQISLDATTTHDENAYVMTTTVAAKTSKVMLGYRVDPASKRAIRNRAHRRGVSVQRYLDSFLLPAIEAAARGNDPSRSGRQEKCPSGGASSVDAPETK